MFVNLIPIPLRILPEFESIFLSIDWLKNKFSKMVSVSQIDRRGFTVYLHMLGQNADVMKTMHFHHTLESPFFSRFFFLPLLPSRYSTIQIQTALPTVRPRLCTEKTAGNMTKKCGLSLRKVSLTTKMMKMRTRRTVKWTHSIL